MQRALLICVFALFASFVASPAHADLILRITDGATTVNVTDQGAGDINPTVGVVAFSGAVGIWNVNMPTGVGFPTFDQAHLDLNSLDINSTGTGTLDILLTQTNLTAPISTWTMNFGETLNGSAGSTTTYMAWRDSTNTAFGLGAANLIGTVGPFGIGPSSGSVMGTVAGTTPYSLTERIRIVATGATNFSGDAELIPSAVPEPGTLTLLGTGLFALAHAARRRMRKGSVG